MHSHANICGNSNGNKTVKLRQVKRVKKPKSKSNSEGNGVNISNTIEQGVTPQPKSPIIYGSKTLSN